MSLRTATIAAWVTCAVACGPARPHSIQIVSGAPTSRSWGLATTLIWRKHIAALRANGCPQVMDVILDWAEARSMATVNYEEGEAFRRVSIPIEKPPGALDVHVNWSADLVGTAPVEGYTIAFDVVFVSEKALSVRQERKLFVDYGLYELRKAVIKEADACGRYEEPS